MTGGSMLVSSLDMAPRAIGVGKRSLIKPTRVVLAVLLVVSCATGCDPGMRHRVLETAFDGVPPPEATPEPRRVRRVRRQFSKKIEPVKVVTPAPREDNRLPVEKAETFQEAMRLLPRDAAGAADWMTAIKRGLIAPRHVLDVEGQASLPFPLEVQLDPHDARFTAIFPHFSHTLWLKCDNCHPQIFQMKRGANPITMEKVFAGEFCGRCHGRVAFTPASDCTRCHVRLVPPEPAAVYAELARARAQPIAPSTPLAQRGGALYRSYCMVCHGEKGGGDGPPAESIDPKPRDFTKGKYKFRLTPGTSVPTDFDIFRSVTMGVPGTAMPSWAILPYEDRWALVAFLKIFSDRFAKETPAASLEIPEPPPVTPELLAEGRQLYVDGGCNSCHGDQGRGDGASAKDLTDDWGNPIRPFDFTSGRPFKSGPAQQDTYRTVMTGLTGTPMPSFGDVFEPPQAWAVVHYVRSLGDEARTQVAALSPPGEGGIELPSPRAIAAELARAKEAGPPPGLDLEEKGRQVYRDQCVICHGEGGSGDGPVAENLDPKPRDFTKGKYKFRLTPGTSVPTDFDIFRSVTMGVPGTSMPPWAILPYEDRWALVAFLKIFSDRFAKETPAASLEIPEPPPVTPELLAEGRQLYVDGGCNSCHGDQGRGDGASAKDLTDDWGNPIRPFDFTGGRPFKSGPAAEDTYRTVMTGLTGTPMPSFGDVFEPPQAWAVVHYVRSLGNWAPVEIAAAK